MRLLTLLATTVLLAACVHDTDETSIFLTDGGASLTVYMDAGAKTDLKTDAPEDPWDRISEEFVVGSTHTGKSDGHDDPWDTIMENFGPETVHTKKNGDHDDPWDAIRSNFPIESTHVGKSEEEPSPWDSFESVFPEGSFHKRSWQGHEKSSAVFVSFRYQAPTVGRARVTEIRGKVLKLEFADGAEQYVVGAPTSWTVGTHIETEIQASTTKKSLPWLGVRVWRTVTGESWGELWSTIEIDEQAHWPKEYVGASLLARLPVAKNDYDDPWDRIQELFPAAFSKDGGGHDDPWDTINDKFGVKSTHSGGTRKSNDGDKEYDDPWDTISESFGVETVHTGRGKKSAPDKQEACAPFMAGCIARVVFFTFADNDELPWGKQSDIVGPKTIRLVEVRGQIGRFEFAGGGSLFGLVMPETFTVGAEFQLNAYLLDDAKLLPLVGALVWTKAPILH